MKKSEPRQISVFIASPGDLAPERKVFKDTIDDLNAGFADGAGVEFVPIGWEDVLAETGRRTQGVINRELDADFDPARFDHVAIWDAANEWIEMRLRSQVAQVVHIRAIDLQISFDAGEEVRTEISAKFQRAGVDDELRRAGLTMRRWWTDPAQDFALSLSRAFG